MSDDFEKLGRINPPKASPEARARALALAMQAFDEAEENSNATQGSVRPVRQSSIFNRIWSPIMNRKLLAGSALATLLVVPAAAFLTFELTRDGSPFGEPAQEIALKGELTKEEARQKPEPQVAAKKAAAEERARQQEAKTVEAPATVEAESEAAAPAAQADAMANSVARDSVAPLSAVGGVQPQMTYLPAPIVQDEMQPAPEQNRERFGKADSNPVKSVATDPVSTFSVDVDTASYAFVRRSLMEGQMPERDAVRVEEMVNYFPYDWPRPASAAEPFKATVTLMPTPWNGGTRLMHVAIKGYDVVAAKAPKANLVFLIDVSGSMDEPDKLPLLKGAFRLLVEKLKPSTLR